MSAVSPQLFPKQLTIDMIPTEVDSYRKTRSSFYIPNCQPERFEEFVRINSLARLFFSDLFSHCLKPDGTINFDQVESWCQLRDIPTIDTLTGRINGEVLKNLHVIGFDYLEQFKQQGCVCPWCHTQVKELITCPLWEIKLRYPDSDIDWSQEQSRLSEPKKVSLVRERSMSESKDFSLIHLIFLIDFVAQGISPQNQPPSEGIVSLFMANDPEYATSVLSALRNELFSAKTDTWMDCLRLRSDLPNLRAELQAFLLECPTRLYERRAFTDYFLSHFPKKGKLQEVKESCELFSTPTEPIYRPVTPARHQHPSLVKEESCMPLRYLLLSTIFICSFLYFFSTLLIAFFKSRFFFGEEI